MLGKKIYGMMMLSMALASGKVLDDKLLDSKDVIKPLKGVVSTTKPTLNSVSKI